MSEEEPVILKFINDYHMALARVRTKAFYTFHSCQMACIRNLKDENDSPENCFASCQRELDLFFQQKERLFPERIDEVFQGPSTVPPQQRDQYIQKAQRTKFLLEKYVRDLNSRLDIKISNYEV